MCGIVGIVHLDGSPFSQQREGSVLRAMGDALTPRGPDDEQLHISGSVGFLFRRLAIVDVEGGRQPIVSEDGAIVHMTNGEIYNHRELAERLFPGRTFRSRSDCEILTSLYEKYGSDFLTPVNGMFATALLDTRNRKLLLSRDRLGIKPLYYHLSRDLLVFASELKALLRHPEVPKEFDWQQALTYSTLRWYPISWQSLPSFFRGIQYLPGGCMLEVDLATGRAQERSYWDPVLASANKPRRTAEEYIDEYRALLEDAVRTHLLSDVEIGLFLSGGIDSTSIACLAAKHAAPFHTFTVLSQSTLGNGDAASAHLAARLHGLPNHQVYFDWRELHVAPSDWKRVLWACESHLTGAEQLYKYCLHTHAKSVRPDLKVMLIGQGSDEFNGGYTSHWAAAEPDGAEASTWERMERSMQDLLRQGLLHKTGGWNEYVNLLPASDLDRGEMFSGTRGRIISLSYLARWAEETLPAHAFDLYRAMYRVHMQVYQLWHEDRTAAAHSIENRVPFLDHRLIEHLYGVPPELHKELFCNKQILRRAMRKDLPAELYDRPKVPFFYGEDQRYTYRLLYRMLQSDGGALVEEALAGSERDGGPLAAAELRRILDEMPTDPDYHGIQPVLALVNMGLLSSMARQASVLPELAALRVPAIEIKNFAEWQKRSAVDLAKHKAVPSLDHIPCFAEGILLVRCEGGDPQWSDPGGHYIIRDQTLLFVIKAETGAWIDFLRLVDGQRTIAQILERARLDVGAIWKYLEEALEQRVLLLRSA